MPSLKFFVFDFHLFEELIMRRYTNFGRSKDYSHSGSYSHYNDFDDYPVRPRAKSKIMGVCAGLARQFDWDVTLVRIFALLCLFTFTIPTLFAYIIAGALFY